MKKFSLPSTVALSLFLLGVAPASSFAMFPRQEPSEGAFSPLSDDVILAAADGQLSPDEMDALRGGFADPSGLIYKFAVDVQTTLKGATIFSRSLVVTPSETAGHFQATNTPTLSQHNLPSNMTLNMMGNGTGVVLTDETGHQTAVLNQTTGGAPASIIMNTANSREIAQTVNVTLTLQNTATIANFTRTATQSARLVQHAAMRSLGF